MGRRKQEGSEGVPGGGRDCDIEWSGWVSVGLPENVTFQQTLEKLAMQTGGMRVVRGAH